MLLFLLLVVCMILVFGKLLVFGIRAAWSISVFLLTVVLLPLILIGMVIGGLIWLAFPLLLVIGIVALVFSKA